MSENSTLTWEDVAHRYGRKIYTFAYRLTGNPDDAADLVQEVLLRVRKGLASYTPGSLEGWLWRITRNAFLDGVRKDKRRLRDVRRDHRELRSGDLGEMVLERGTGMGQREIEGAIIEPTQVTLKTLNFHLL